LRIVRSRLLTGGCRESDVPSLATTLNDLYETYNDPQSAADPIHVVRRFERADDREVVAFCAAGLAFGRVASVIQSTDRLLSVMGPRPAAYIRRLDPARARPRFASLGHRWIRGTDLLALVWVLRQMLDRAGSIEAFFAEGDPGDDEDVGAALDAFSSRALGLDLTAAYGQRTKRPGVSYFFPRPASGSACKRLNLFLRWMVRRDRLDLGLWSRVSPARLVVPLDTHVIRLGRCLGLTRYTSPGWPMAREITASLRRLDPADPVRFDFALCHLGMANACGFNRPDRDGRCPLRGLCQPHARTPRRSRRPSDRR
jgi:uncharacterized protein (TIGR02757 family)